jgi:site-specific DNA recombinase
MTLYSASGNAKLKAWKQSFTEKAVPCQKSARAGFFYDASGVVLVWRTTARNARKAAALDLNTVRVGVYLRRSTYDEHQPYSIDAQDARLDAFVQSQPGWSIVTKFTDDASGANTDRPGLKKAMRWARSGFIDVLLVYRVDRFSRNLRDTVTLLDELDLVAWHSGLRPSRSTRPRRRVGCSSRC